MNVALVAHDSKKTLMENLCIAYRHILNKHTCFATGTTGRIIEEAAVLNINKYLEGRLGGEQQLAIQIANNDIDLVIYLCDPTSDYGGEPGVLGIMRLCNTHNIPFASNIATAEALLLALRDGNLSWRELVR
jgi:methylglyoxal synthase